MGVNGRIKVRPIMCSRSPTITAHRRSGIGRSWCAIKDALEELQARRLLLQLLSRWALAGKPRAVTEYCPQFVFLGQALCQSDWHLRTEPQIHV